MTRWPSPAEYCETVQNPAVCFADPDLASADVERTAMGLPAPRSGASGTVFRLVRDDKSSWAVKCFTREIPGLMDRYAEVNGLLGEAKLPYSVRFDFVPKGIHVGGDWRPIVKMEWVAGETLNVVVKNMLGDPEKLDKLSAIWERMNAVLEEKKIIHGDLQHGNVLMTRADGKGAFKLVDYDGLATYGATGSPADERGHPSYQHPDRTERNQFGPGVDRFSGLVIAAAIRALRAGGRPLWDEFDDGQRLLFSDTDLKWPSSSPVFYQCRRLTDPVARRLCDRLAEYCTQPLDRVPPLAEVLAQPVTVAVPAPPPLAPPPAAKPPAVVVVPEPRNELTFSPAEKPKARRPRRAKKRKGPPPWAYAALAVALAVLVVFFAAVVPQFRSTAKSDPKDRGAAKDGGKEKDAVKDKAPAKAATPGATEPRTPADPPAASGPMVSVLGFHRYGRVTWVAVSADGKRAATCGDDLTVRVWDIDLKKQVAELKGHPRTVWTVALSRDGRAAYSGGEGGAVFSWNVFGESGYSLYNHAPGATVGRVDISDDGGRLVSCAWDRKYTVWDIARGQQVVSHGTTHPTDPPVVGFRPGRSGKLLFWDAALDFQILSVPSEKFPPTAPKLFDDFVVDLLSASPDGKYVTVGANRRTQIADLDRPSPAVVSTVPAPNRLRGGRQFTGDGAQVLLGSEQTNPALWDWRTGRKVAEFPNPPGLSPFSAALVPGDSHAVVGYTDGSIRLWRVR